MWVNVAFTPVVAPFDKITPAEFRRVRRGSVLWWAGIGWRRNR